MSIQEQGQPRMTKSNQSYAVRSKPVSRSLSYAHTFRTSQHLRQSVITPRSPAVDILAVSGLHSPEQLARIQALLKEQTKQERENEIKQLAASRPRRKEMESAVETDFVSTT